MVDRIAERKLLEARKSRAARKYLAEALPLGNWAAVSRELDHNHAFLQQYIRRGKPLFLSEADRDRLAALYDLDPEKLKPPPKSADLVHFRLVDDHQAGVHRGDQPDVGLHRLDEIIDDPGTLKLIWACLRIVGDKEKRRHLRSSPRLARPRLPGCGKRRRGTSH
jgi:hypothetical protein